MNIGTRFIKWLRSEDGMFGVDCPDNKDIKAVEGDRTLVSQLKKSQEIVDKLYTNLNASNSTKAGKPGNGIVDKVDITPESTLAQANIARKNAKQPASKGNDEKQIGE